MGKERPHLDSVALIDIAAAHDHRITARALESWRYRGLLQRPRRQLGGRAVWLYPPGTDGQLLRLLFWRERTRNLDEVLLALWVEGFEIEQDRVRAALVGFVDRWDAMTRAEIGDASQEDETSAVDALARKFARMRGDAALPRLSRMRLSDRERACGYLVAAMFGMEGELARREADLPHLERLLGLRRGHGGGLSAILGVKDAKGRIGGLPTSAEAREAIRSAQPYELEYVRHVVQFLLVVLPVAIPALFADQAVKAAGIVEFARRFLAEPPPGLFPFLLMAFLVPLRVKESPAAELREYSKALNSSAFQDELSRLSR